MFRVPAQLFKILMSSCLVMDEHRYGELLAQFRPRLIESGEEHERLLTIAETLMERGEQLGAEEEQLLSLIVLLIEAFESYVLDEEEPEDEAAEQPLLPHLALQRLMESHRLELQDVADVFGNPHLTREVLQGTRAISRNQAKQLGKLFRVPPKLFESQEQK
ncbi:MAG: hypothetical protein WKF37_09140 [Bryobacteraceae bacterium]